MKTLKFMLAAATAIGLASASQAAGPTLGSTSFESYSGDITDQTDANQFVLPTGWEVGDYSIITEGLPSDGIRSAGAASKWSSNTKALKLEGGTEPLLLKINKSNASTPLTADAPLYIDTLVQFTVTPAGDTVTASASDKLMVYLKEDLTVGSEATNLVVKAGYYDGQTTTAREYPLVVGQNVRVQPGVWYRLTVEAINNVCGTGFNCVGFKISLNGDSCVGSVPFPTDVQGALLPFMTGSYFTELQGGSIFLSLLGMDGDTTLTSVGFAGSGAVDDVLITTFNPTLTVIDFTLVLDDTAQGINGAVYFSTEAMGRTELSGTVTGYCYGGQGATDKVTMEYAFKTDFGGTWSSGGPASATGSEYFTPTAGATYTLTTAALITTVDFTFTLNAGVSSVLWTIDGATTNEVLATGTVTADSGAVLTIAGVNYAAWYVKASESLGAGDTVTAAAAANYQFSASAIGNGSGEVVVPSGTTAADLGINNSAFASDTPEQLTKLATWARANSVSMSTINDTTAMDFTEGAESQAAKAFLLNCANTSEAVEAAEAAFKFDSFDPSDLPEAEDFASKGYNGTVTIKGAAVLGTWHDKASGDKFYKATLTK